MTVYAYGCILFICFFVGFYLGRSSAFKQVVIKSKKDYRTSIKIGDNFYYIIPEPEYVKGQNGQDRA